MPWPAAASLTFTLALLFVASCATSGPSQEYSHAGDLITEWPAGAELTLRDHLGSGVAIVDDKGADRFQRSYHPYGSTRSEFDADLSAATGQADHYVGNERDVGADLGHFHARPYDYQVGRFLGPDPLRLFPSWGDDASTAQLAAYSYTAGNPIGLMDPDGRAPIGEVLWNTFAGGNGPKISAGGVGRGAQKVQGAIRPLTDFIDPEVQRQAAVNDISDGAVMIRSGDLKGGLAKIQSGQHRAMWFGTLVMGEILLGGNKGAKAAPGGVQTAKQLCFAAGTLVETDDGLRPIEQIEPGDLVWSRDEHTNEESWKPVVQTFVTPDQAVLDLKLLEVGGAQQDLAVTAEHPLWTWNGWAPVAELNPGSRVWARGGWAEVLSVSDSGLLQTVYNFEVADFHTYFVGVGGVWTHNTCFPTAKELARAFGTNANDFHRAVKPGILKDAGSFMKKIGAKNPDIGISKAGDIMLRNPKTGKTITTDLMADWFKL